MHLKSDQPLYLDVLQKLILMKTNMPYFLTLFLLIIDIHYFAAAKLLIFFQILSYSYIKNVNSLCFICYSGIFCLFYQNQALGFLHYI